MKFPRIAALAVIASAATIHATAAHAQAMKPGLWELTNKMQSGSGELESKMAQMQQQLASLPPEQRKMVQDMMAKQGVTPGSGGATSVKMCVTKEMAERNEMPAQSQGNCTSSSSPRSGNTMRLSFTCTNPASSGEGMVTFSGDDAYAVKMAVTTTVQGKPGKINIDGTGKWLAADCGSVQPPAMPKR